MSPIHTHAQLSIRNIRRLLIIAFGCLALALSLGAGEAGASHGQATFFEDTSELLNPATRSKALGELEHLGVKALRVELYWHSVAPAADSSRRPSFDATDPNSYSWGGYDWVLSEAARLKWQVLLTVTSPVPKWATAGHKDLVTRPNDTQLREFMTAVGRRYGSEASLFAIWNEPNHPAFLLPQFNRRNQPESPRIYRGLFQAGYEGLKAAGIAKPKLLMGETAPFGYDKVNVRHEGRKALLHDVSPLAFLRGALCLNTHYRKSGTCGMLPAYGYAHHAYTTGQGPSYRPPADDVTIGVLSRLSSALDRAARAHAIRAHIPIYLTEYGVQSKPSILGVSLAKQAEFDALSEKIAWANGRVAGFSQYLLRDDPLSSGPPGSSVHGGYIGFQTGLVEHNGKRKPLYYGFPVPLVVSKRRGGYSLWGLVRPATGVTKVKVLVKAKHAKRYSTLKIVTTDSHGYWSLRSSRPGASWRVSWRSPAGVAYNGPPIKAM
ncbi:MAG TPA: hypothetical protein VMU55_00165 [Solirubrobacteraceae bacterium]|nr:hypothetical protein [Solirubrobacteraceae bacterium]